MQVFYIHANCTTALRVSGQPIATEEPVPSRTSPWGICDGESDKGTGVLSIRFSSGTIIPTTLHTHISFIQHARYVNSAVYSVVKQNASSLYTVFPTFPFKVTTVLIKVFLACTRKHSIAWYFGFGVLHGVQVNLVDDVSETTVGPIFTGQKSSEDWGLLTSEDGIHSGFRNVVY
jgi:hypothetical protein